MRIELVGQGCPVLPGVTVGVQRGGDVVQAVPADGGEVRWELEARVAPGPDLLGPDVHGRRGDRFLYLVWSRPPDGMFRRAKLMLDEVRPATLLAAEHAGLRGTVSLTMPDGSPLCAAVRPPVVTWDAL